MPHSLRRIVLRLACAVALLLPALPSFDALMRKLQADDNVGRFPPRTVAVESEDEKNVELSSASEPPPPPIPTFAPPPLPNPFDASPDYGWPGREEGHAFQAYPQRAGVHARGDAGASWFTPGNPDDPARHIGVGQPLWGTSWLNRPHYTALLLGSMIADNARGNADLHNDLFIGLHQGWDVDHYHGVEARIAGGAYDVYNSPADSTANIALADAHLLHYPWGDARWRPYYSLGLGLAHHHLRDNAGEVHSETLFHFPLGIGLKYQWKRHCAMRFDVKHNLNFGGGGLSAMDHVSLSYGFEYRYGGRPKGYFPWNPSVRID